MSYNATQRVAIDRTLQPVGLEGYRVSGNSDALEKPPYYIADVALSRVTSAIEFPNGFDADELRRLRTFYGRTDLPQDMSLREGAAFMFLGRQILDLNTNGKIQPPLTNDEKYSIERLVRVVTATETSIELRR